MWCVDHEGFSSRREGPLKLLSIQYPVISVTSITFCVDWGQFGTLWILYYFVLFLFSLLK